MSTEATPRRRPSDAGAPAVTRRPDAQRILEFALVGVLVVLVVAATAIYPRFLEAGNLAILLSQVAPLGVVAVGVTVVIIAGGFDLSVGAIYACAATVFTWQSAEAGVVPAAGMAMGLAVLLGLANGLIIVFARINPFIATLGTASVYSGGVLFLTNATAYSNSDPGFRVLARSSLLGIPMPIIILGLTFVVGTVLLERTRYGRNVLAVGGNEQAARLTGLNVPLVKAATYVLSGFLAGLAGLMTASEIGAGQGTMGAGVALDAIAIAVIGGTSLSGGEGRIWKTALGLLVIAVLDNILFSLSVDSNAQLIIKGAIVVLAVSADRLVRRG